VARAVVTLATLVAGLAGGSLAAPSTAAPTGTGAGSSPATSPATIPAASTAPGAAVHDRAPAPRRAAGRTTLTLAVSGCARCEVYLQRAITRGPVWVSRTKRVRHGEVTYRLPHRRTRGLSVVVRAPWEGATGYVTNVVFRYHGKHVGDRVGFRKARATNRASGCWAGTRKPEITIPVAVHKVRVPGVRGRRVAGTLAYTEVTQPWKRPMSDAFKGILGNQDAMYCHR